MKINEAAGVIYDAIFYSYIYFNKEKIYQRLKPYADKDSDIFAYYDQMRKGNQPLTPSEDFYPFFYVSLQEQSFMTAYFRKYFKFDTGTYADFLALFKDKHALKRALIFHYFDRYQDEIKLDQLIDGDVLAVTKAMVHLRTHGDRMNAFVRIFCDFDSLVEELVSYLEQLLHKVKLFHAKNKGVCDIAVENFCKKENLHVISKAYNLDTIKVEEQSFGISLFHPYIYMLQFDHPIMQGFVIGHQAYLAVPSHTAFRHVTAAMISRIYSNDIMESIIDALSVEDLTITQLSMRLHVSRTTIDRLIGDLYDDLAVLISKSNGNEKYYRVNPDFFLAGKEAFINKINVLMEKWRK